MCFARLFQDIFGEFLVHADASHYAAEIKQKFPVTFFSGEFKLQKHRVSIRTEIELI